MTTYNRTKKIVNEIYKDLFRRLGTNVIFVKEIGKMATKKDYINLITVSVEEIDQDKVGYYLIEEDEKPAKVKTDVDLNEMLNSSL